MSLRCLVILVLGVALAVYPPRVAASAAAELHLFAPGERARLFAGELVTRPREVETGDRLWMGGSAWLIVDAPVERVWAVVARPELYRHLLPHAVESRPFRGGVSITHAVGPSRPSYRLKVQRDDRRRALRFAVLPNAASSVRAGHAQLSISSIDAVRSLVAWSVMADPELGLLGALLRASVQEAMLEVPLRIRDAMRTRLDVGVDAQKHKARSVR